MRTLLLVAALLLGACAAPGTSSANERRLAGGTRHDEAGWVYLHLEGSPDQIGFQYGWLAAPEIRDALAMFRQYLPGATQHDWGFFRDAAARFFEPKLDEEERAELDGMVFGLRARDPGGAPVDRLDLVALNGWIELAWYYLPALAPATGAAPGNCSAFIATGSWTSDGGIVMGHNAWVDYAVAERWNLVIDLVPEHGHRVFMDSFPGFLHSGDDFALNDAGLMVTETTITGFHGFEPGGIPEFCRARRALQYAGSIDEWVAIMCRGNNGAYANSWLVGDRTTGEIARLELGLRSQPLERTRDGYFVGSNFPADAKLCAEETSFDPADPDLCANARRRRWEQLMLENRGRIDVAAGERFLADHVDVRTGAEQPGGRTLCGHLELDAQGASEWGWAPFYPGGAGQAKVTDSTLAARLAFRGFSGHACGRSFEAGAHLGAHPEFAWQRPFLRDLPAGRWTLFGARR